MAVTITDRRATINNAQNTTGWTGAGFGTTTSDVAENTAVAAAFNIATGQVYYTDGTGTDLSNSLVYIWIFNNALQNSWTTGATALLLGDGTDQIAFHIVGGDRFAFRHLEGPVNWNSCVLDGSQASAKNTAGETTVVAGSFAALTLTAITQYGGHFITQSKALGGGYNCAVDIIRVGNNGIRITGGGSGTEGKFSEIAAGDRSTATGAGHGVLRELQPIAFGCQAPLTFGDSTSGGNSYFEDSGISLIYEAWDIGNSKYYLAIEGDATSTNSFSLSNSTISSAGPFITGTFNGGNINTLNFDAVVFSQWGNSLTFSNNADATGHTITGCSFDGCGQIDPGDVTFSGNIISNTTANTTGALLLDADGASNWSNIEIIAGVDATSHGIYIPPAADGTYDFTGIVGTNYDTTNGGPKALIYNNSGGIVVINADSASSGLTYLNGTSATTTINNSVTVTVTVKDATTLANIQNARVYLTIDAGATVLFNELTNVSGVVTTSYNYTLDKAIAGVVRKGSASPLYKEGTLAGTITGSGLNITVLLVGDE